MNTVKITRTVTYTAELNVATIARLTGETETDVRANIAADTIAAFLADYATPELNDAVANVASDDWEAKGAIPATVAEAHQITIGYVQGISRMYRARCTCKWQDNLAHMGRIAAEDRGADHVMEAAVAYVRENDTDELHPEVENVLAMVELVRKRVPNAAYIHLGWSDQGGNHMNFRSVLDAGMNMIETAWGPGEYDELDDRASALHDTASDPWTQFRTYYPGVKFGDVNAEEESSIDIAKVVRELNL